MNARRPLVEGLDSPAQPVDPQVARNFIYGGKTNSRDNARTSAINPTESDTPAPSRGLGTAAVNTRIRSDYVAILKRAVLERKLKDVEPNTLKDILEEAITPWLQSHGYLP